MKLTEYIYYIYSYINIYRNNKIVSISEQYLKNWDFFLKYICYLKFTKEKKL